MKVGVIRDSRARVLVAVPEISLHLDFSVGLLPEFAGVRVHPVSRKVLDFVWGQLRWAETVWGLAIPPAPAWLSSELDHRLTLNAMIRMDEQSVVTAYHAGLAFALYDFFAEIGATAELSAPADVLVSQEGPQAKENQFYDYSYLLGRSEEEAPAFMPAIVPGNELRWKLASQLLDLALLFTALHEHCHFLCGHLHQLQANGALVQLQEQPEAGAGTSTADTDAVRRQRGWELEADGMAAMIIFMASEDANVLGSTHLGKQMDSALWQNLALIAMSSMFGLFQAAAEKRGIQTPAATHPSAGCRLLNVLHRYILYLGQRGAWPSLGVMEDVLDHLAVLFKRLDIAPIQLSDVTSALFDGLAPKDGTPAAEFLSLADHSDGPRVMPRVGRRALEKMGGAPAMLKDLVGFRMPAPSGIRLRMPRSFLEIKRK
jgi:hypothetical protein